MTTLRISLIGCGSIGRLLMGFIQAKESQRINVVSIFDADSSAAERLSSSFSTKKPKIASRFEEVLSDDSSLVIEAAGMEAAKKFVPLILGSSKSVMMMSVGAFADARFRQEISRLSEETGMKVYVPTGAIAGLDGLKAASLGRITEVTLTSTKPPEAFFGVSYISQKGINLGAIKEPIVVFSGNAEEACPLFPANVNVAAALSLAGIGFRETKVRIVIDPTSKVNTHEVFVKGEFGSMRVLIENVPSRFNPKTSAIAPMSAARRILDMVDGIVVGT